MPLPRGNRRELKRIGDLLERLLKATERRETWKFEQITVSTTPKGLNLDLPVYPVRVIITVEKGSIQFRTDNGSIAWGGHTVGTGAVIELENDYEIKKFQAIRASAYDALLSVTYEIPYVTGVRRAFKMDVNKKTDEQNGFREEASDANY